MGVRNRVGGGLSYRPARVNRLAESIPDLLKSFKIQSLIEKDANKCAQKSANHISCETLLWFLYVVYSMVLVLVFKFTEPGIK